MLFIRWYKNAFTNFANLPMYLLYRNQPFNWKCTNKHQPVLMLRTEVKKLIPSEYKFF